MLERERLGISSEWKLTWNSLKSALMLTNFDTIEVEMSKYLIMDDSFELAIDCIRHELAHVIAGYDSLSY